MKNYIGVAYALFSTLLFFSCEKEPNEVKPAKGDYFPTTIGSKWRYSAPESSSAEETEYLSVQEVIKDTVIGDFKFTELYFSKENNGIPLAGNQTFVRKENGNYYSNFSVYGYLYDNYEKLFLKDYAIEGEKWISSRNEAHYEHYTEYAVISIDLLRKVNDKTYANTIEIKEDIYSGYDGNVKLFSITTKIYARNVGLIFSSFDYNNINTIETLFQHQVK